MLIVLGRQSMRMPSGRTGCRGYLFPRHNLPSYRLIILSHPSPALPHRTLPSHLQAIRVGIDYLAVMRQFGWFGVGGRTV